MADPALISIDPNYQTINPYATTGFIPAPYPSDMQGADSMAQWDSMNQANEDRLFRDNQWAYQLDRDAMFDQMELDRQFNIESSLGRITDIFAGRSPLYSAYADDTFNLSKIALDDENARNDRQLGFSLARHGLSGGSTDTDKYRDLANKYSFGLQQARGHADAAGDSLRAQDSTLKSSLMGLAASGAVGSDQMSNISGEALSAVNTTPTAMANPQQFYMGLYDQIGAAGMGGAPTATNPYAAGSSSTFNPTSGGTGFQGTVS